MYEKIKRFGVRFFAGGPDFRVRLFNVLAFAGVGISVATFGLNLFTGMVQSALLSALLAVLSAGLLIFTYKTGKYQIGYFVTVVSIFMILFPMQFFASGGYKGGMPSLFIFAILFTILMLEGKTALLVSLFEFPEYATISVFAYFKPEYVTWFESEKEMLADLMVTTAAVCISCGVVLFLHLREYEKQRIKLAEQNEQLKRHDEAKSVFLTTVAHEIKNPLNAINLHARDTYELLDEPNPEIDLMKENQKTIEKMVVRIDRIVVELMDTVAIKQGRLSLDLAPVCLSKLLREAAGSYFLKNYTGGNELCFDLDASLPPIAADSARIMQVVTNLLSNSLRHTKNGKITLSIKSCGEGQLISVSDNGEGMSEKMKQKALKGYVSVSKEYWRHGIGLYVCHKIIVAHGGKIWIESEQDKGTTVSFILPGTEEKGDE